MRASMLYKVMRVNAATIYALQLPFPERQISPSPATEDAPFSSFCRAMSPRPRCHHFARRHPDVLSTRIRGSYRSRYLPRQLR